MSERQLPWYAKSPFYQGLPDGSAIDWKRYTVWDGAGHVVCECHGDDEGAAEAAAICIAINRMGDKACHNCGEPAACFGSYEDELHPAYACDDCCAHGNEDGHCERLPGIPPCVACGSAEHADCGQQ